MVSALSMLVMAVMSLPPKRRERGRPNGPARSLSSCRFSVAALAAAVGFHKSRNTKAGPARMDRPRSIASYGLSVAADAPLWSAPPHPGGRRALHFCYSITTSNRPVADGNSRVIVVMVCLPVGVYSSAAEVGCGGSGTGNWPAVPASFHGPRTIRRTTRAMMPRPARLRKKVSPPVPVSSGPAISRATPVCYRGPLVPPDEAADLDR